MMLSETLFLNQSCENCGSTEYMEHDSGFYVCTNCAVVSQMRHGLALDYKDLNTKGMKFKRKNVEEDEHDDQVDLNNFETNMNTVNNTCANSEYNDSVTSRLTKHESLENRPVSEVLLDHQVIFLKIFKSVFYYQYLKKKNYLEKEIEYNTFCKKKVFGELNKFESCENLFTENNFNFNFKNVELTNLDRQNSCLKVNSKYDYNENFNLKNAQKKFYENLLSKNHSDMDNLKNSNNTLEKFEHETKQNYEILLELAKEKWMQFIKSEYENQIKKRGPNFRKRGIRSRRNTEDEFSQLNTVASHNTKNNNSLHNQNYINNNLNSSNLNFTNINLNNNNENIKINNKETTNNNNQNNLYRNNNREKRRNLNEELKSRKIKSKNIVQLDAYKNTRLRNKEKKKKFIEEHDQVLSMLKKAHDYILTKTGISIDETVSFKNMLVLADLFGIKISDNASYEDLIHSFFITKELNYRNLYSEKTFDENKSNLDSDNFLSLIYQCFSNKINSFNKDFPILIYELISLYKKFNINLHSQEIKFLKYLSKEKLFKSLEKIKQPSNRALKVIDYICQKLLKMPSHFNKFAQSIFNISEFAINKNLTHIYNIEAFGIAIAIISLRYFYGLNDLPYLVELKKAIQKGILKHKFFEENKKIKEILILFEEVSQKDNVFRLYSEMPSVYELIENLILLIKEDESNTSLWDGVDFKKYSDLDFKSNYIEYNNHYLFPKHENNSCVRNINELEKKIESKLEKILSENDFKNSDFRGITNKERKISLIHKNHSNDDNYEVYSVDSEYQANKNDLKNKENINNDNNKNFDKKEIKFNIKFSKKFEDKLKFKNKNILNNNSITNAANEKGKNNIKQLNKFLREEIDFYKMLAKKNKKNKKIAIPLPCDTIVRFNKKAFKFDGIVPPTTELVIYYLFSRYFEIEVQVLRKCIKILEKVIDDNSK